MQITKPKEFQIKNLKNIYYFLQVRSVEVGVGGQPFFCYVDKIRLQYRERGTKIGKPLNFRDPYSIIGTGLINVSTHIF